MKRSLAIALSICLIWGSIADPAPAAEKDPRLVLFNGENLDGWQVTGCDAGVENGLLVIRSGDGLVRSDLKYRDFKLELDWRARKASAWDSGVYFRSDLPPMGKPWPSRYQVNLEQGKEGTVKGLPGAESSGLAKPGEWNHLELTVVGDHAELKINGQAAWSVGGLKPRLGYVGLQAEVAKGGEFEFREIAITELGYEKLFDGESLAGWEGGGADAAACWRVENGELLCTGAEGPWLRHVNQRGDFDLRLEYQLKSGGNSGVYVRVPEGGAHRGKELDPGPSGVEIQILDDASDRYRDLAPYQFSGSIYAIAPATEHVSRPAGRWNSLEIDCRGTKYEVTHNGVTIIRADEKTFPELAERLKEGFLGLQNHSEEVRFRDLRIGPPLVK